MNATIDEVRSLTGFDRETISGVDMVSLDSRARKELTADVGQAVDFTTPAADTALFWLLCLFSKIHTGDIGASGFAIAELEERPLDDESNLWLTRYQQRRRELQSDQGVRFGHTTSARSDRQYGTDE